MRHILRNIVPIYSTRVCQENFALIKYFQILIRFTFDYSINK